MSRYERSYKIHFDQCDMAGIVFFPNYLVMFNRLFEDWFCDELKVSLGEYHSERKSGLPLINVNVSFHKPSLAGDILDWTLQVNRIGGKSLGIKASAACRDELRVEVETTMVSVNLVPGGIVSREIPADIRARMEPFLVQD